MTTVDNSVDSVDNQDETAVEPETENKGVRIPGAIWPDPKDMDFKPDRRDPFSMQHRVGDLKKRRHTDLQDE